MKKIVLFSLALVYIICLVVNLYGLTMGLDFETIILIAISLCSLVALFYVYKNKYVKKSLEFLWFINLIQAFSIIIFGFTYKIIIGPDISLYFINSGDKLVQSSIKVFNVYGYFNYVANDSTIALGVNFFHLFLFVYLFFESKNIDKLQIK